MITAYATIVAAETAAGNHTWEIVLAVATIGLAVATSVLIVATSKLAKVTADDASKLANNSVDSMEHVAVEAIHHDRHRDVLRLASGRTPVHHHRRAR